MIQKGQGDKSITLMPIRVKSGVEYLESSLWVGNSQFLTLIQPIFWVTFTDNFQIVYQTRLSNKFF